jgi:Na+-transporting NADH:ubiquinone oxidoreductase subunit NqrE
MQLYFLSHSLSLTPFPVRHSQSFLPFVERLYCHICYLSNGYVVISVIHRMVTLSPAIRWMVMLSFLPFVEWFIHVYSFLPFAEWLYCHFCHSSNGYVVTCHLSNGYVVISAIHRMVTLSRAIRWMVMLSFLPFVEWFIHVYSFLPFVEWLYCHFCHSSNGYIVTCHLSNGYVVISAIHRMVTLSPAIRRMVYPRVFISAIRRMVMLSFLSFIEWWHCHLPFVEWLCCHFCHSSNGLSTCIHFCHSSNGLSTCIHFCHSLSGYIVIFAIHRMVP